ncbi:MAG: phosphoribosyl 1,2-cyclic phosphate phosphodiesterase [Sphingobacteriales bacterium]|jgi:phosphoribosyl 1,2-cyclic phosphate phosphodiesterase
MKKNRIIFLGTGTSQGVPVIACDCKICTSNDPKDARLRSSVYVEYEGLKLVVDSGPDFRQQMLREKIQKVDSILFTHEHKDHTAGLDDVRAFNFKWKMDMPLYAEERVQASLKNEFSYIFSGIKYPGIPQVNLVPILENVPLNIQGKIIEPIRGFHYKLPVFGFRFGGLSYITDINSMPNEEIEKIKGSEILVINALRKEKHISHFNLDEALEFIEKVQPKKAYLTHISHLFGLHELEMKTLPEGVEIAFDGLNLSF